MEEEVNRNYVENLADKMLLLLDIKLIQQIFHHYIVNMLISVPN